MSKRSVCPKHSAAGRADQTQVECAGNVQKGEGSVQTFHSRTALVFYRVVFGLGCQRFGVVRPADGTNEIRPFGKYKYGQENLRRNRTVFSAVLLKINALGVEKNYKKGRPATRAGHTRSHQFALVPDDLLLRRCTDFRLKRTRQRLTPFLCRQKVGTLQSPARSKVPVTVR